jgi:hypothetical protein
MPRHATPRHRTVRQVRCGRRHPFDTHVAVPADLLVAEPPHVSRKPAGSAHMVGATAHASARTTRRRLCVGKDPVRPCPRISDDGPAALPDAPCLEAVRHSASRPACRHEAWRFPQRGGQHIREDRRRAGAARSGPDHEGFDQHSRDCERRKSRDCLLDGDCRPTVDGVGELPDIIRVPAGACATTAATRAGSLWCSTSVARRCGLVPGGRTPRAVSMRRNSSDVVSFNSVASG